MIYKYIHYTAELVRKLRDEQTNHNQFKLVLIIEYNSVERQYAENSILF